MKAFAFVSKVDSLGLEAIEIEEPFPSKDEVLVRVLAAGVTPTELLWYPSTHKRDGSHRANAVPGHEFSGTIEAIGLKLQDSNRVMRSLE